MRIQGAFNGGKIGVATVTDSAKLTITQVLKLVTERCQSTR